MREAFRFRVVEFSCLRHNSGDICVKTVFKTTAYKIPLRGRCAEGERVPRTHAGVLRPTGVSGRRGARMGAGKGLRCVRWTRKVAPWAQVRRLFQEGVSG